MTIEKIKGKEITICFDGKKCIHSRNCVLSRPDVFVPNAEGEWIRPDNATVEEIKELAHNCPSGAISYEIDSINSEKNPLVNTVKVVENGPLAVTANINLENKEGHKRLTLCRCGASENKPFCDGSHVKVGFHATGEVPSKESELLEKRDGELKITTIKDGPLIVEGNVELIANYGRTIDRNTKCSLCRCGASENKPFCDGSHVKIGFKSEE